MYIQDAQTPAIQPPRGMNIRPKLRKERKELVGRFYQLLSSHASIGTCLCRENAHDLVQRELVVWQ